MTMPIEALPVTQIKFAGRCTALRWLAFTGLSRWYWCIRTRWQLADLDAHGLRDIGLSEADRKHECARLFWDGTS
jgi:uncharacterized protein YjiS (DUF1127 family)